MTDKLNSVPRRTTSRLWRRRLLLFMTVLLLLGGVGLSRPGSALLSKMFSRGNAPGPVRPTQPVLDLEQQVRARVGWNSTLVNSVITGVISFYDWEGQNTGQANFSLTRKYPALVRLDLARGAAVESVGFDGTQAWKSGTRSLNAQDAREIRAWLRMWPERLFNLRDAGALYREAGPRVEDFRPASPFQAAARIDPPLTLQQIEMQDTIGPAPDAQQAGDRRSVYYYIDQQTLLIKSARWLEPDDPRNTDQDSPKLDSRVDFGNWLQLSGVMWPTQITRWLGGRVQFRIEVIDVKVNQPLGDAQFRA